MKAIKSLKVLDLVIALSGVGLAIAIRYSLLDFKSIDFYNYTHGWYNTIKGNGFSAFRTDFSNYNLPYLYLLYVIARFGPETSAVIATKLPSLLADFAMAWLAAQIVRIKHPKTIFPSLAAFAILFAPTIVLNSAFWGQADALYTAALMACIYFLLIKRNALAMLFFGLSLAFKAQAIFLSPLLLALFFRKEIPWKYFLIIPFVMFLALVPAWIAGRPILELLLIYPSQAGQYEQLSMHAPTILSWIPDSGQFYPYFYPAGLTIAGAAGLLFSISVYRSHKEFTPETLVELALVSVVMMPFLLPKMHERYFYPADVITIIFAFYFPSYFYIPVLMSMISFFAYQPTLFGVEPVPINLLALGILAILVLLIKDVISKLHQANAETEFSGEAVK